MIKIRVAFGNIASQPSHALGGGQVASQLLPAAQAEAQPFMTSVHQARHGSRGQLANRA